MHKLRAVHPFRAAPFLHRLTGARELPQAGSPLTGGKFFAEPQQRNSPSADGGSGAAPAAGAKRKDNLRFSFLFELLPFPYSLVWRRLPTCDRFEKENGRGFLLPCLSLPIRSVRYRTATHTGYSTQGRTLFAHALMALREQSLCHDSGILHSPFPISGKIKRTLTRPFLFA